MSENYWAGTLRNRMSRRRVLAATGATAAGAALLAACGGGSDEPQKVDKETLIARFVDTTKSATKGGIWQSYMARSSITFDPQVGTAADLAHASHAYQRLLRQKLGTVFSPPDGSVEPDAASSFEVSPDRLTVTLKLRANNKLDPRPPTNGRAVTTEDVKFSFDRFASLSPNRGNVLNSVSKDLPVLGLTTPDASTIVVRLAFPDSAILSMLAWGWFLNVMPVEADGKFEPRSEMRGSGPWMMTDFKPSASWTYRANPNWHRTSEGLPYLEGIDYALIQEPAVAEAQFKAGRLWSLNTPNPDNVLTIKRENPGALLYQQTPRQGNGGYRLLSPSKRPDSPLMDARVLQAASMLIDRDALNDVFGNTGNFSKQGLEVESVWHSHTPASWSSIWLDPKSGKLGPDSKFFQHNPDEAARLLRAAGKFGLEQEYTMWTPVDPAWQRQTEVVAQMLQEGGHFKLKTATMDYNSAYQPLYLRSGNQFQGWAPFQVFSGLPDWNMVMWNHTNPGARNDYISDWNNVPGLKEVMEKSRMELDEQKRIGLAHEWQKLMAKHMPFIPYSMPSGTGSFSLAWPWYGNYGVFKTYGTFTDASDWYPRVWHDKAKEAK
jgi:ABC-type transport system substrate-binding protein